MIPGDLSRKHPLMDGRHPWVVTFWDFSGIWTRTESRDRPEITDLPANAPVAQRIERRFPKPSQRRFDSCRGRTAGGAQEPRQTRAYLGFETLAPRPSWEHLRNSPLPLTRLWVRQILQDRTHQRTGSRTVAHGRPRQACQPGLGPLAQQRAVVWVPRRRASSPVRGRVGRKRESVALRAPQTTPVQ
jgi:hypothetical protein